MFDILNMFGITCTVQKNRELANDWSEKRNPLDDIDKNSFLEMHL